MMGFAISAFTRVCDARVASTHPTRSPIARALDEAIYHNELLLPSGLQSFAFRSAGKPAQACQHCGRPLARHRGADKRFQIAVEFALGRTVEFSRQRFEI